MIIPTIGNNNNFQGGGKSCRHATKKTTNTETAKSNWKTRKKCGEVGIAWIVIISKMMLIRERFQTITQSVQ